jgi:hypothetical protein
LPSIANTNVSTLSEEEQYNFLDNVALVSIKQKGKRCRDEMSLDEGYRIFLYDKCTQHRYNPNMLQEILSAKQQYDTMYWTRTFLTKGDFNLEHLNLKNLSEKEAKQFVNYISLYQNVQKSPLHRLFYGNWSKFRNVSKEEILTRCSISRDKYLKYKHFLKDITGVDATLKEQILKVLQRKDINQNYIIQRCHRLRRSGKTFAYLADNWDLITTKRIPVIDPTHFKDGYNKVEYSRLYYQLTGVERRERYLDSLTDQQRYERKERSKELQRIREIDPEYRKQVLLNAKNKRKPQNKKYGPSFYQSQSNYDIISFDDLMDEDLTDTISALL